MPLHSLNALAKINLALHVGPVQKDGYHPVDTLCVFAEAGDVLTIGEDAPAFSLTMSGQEGGLEPSEYNLVLRAARLYAGANPLPPVAFHLEKNVPVASGVGGGTSNGAAALYLLNCRADHPLSDEQLMQLSRQLGADGPVCLAPLLMRADSFRAGGIGFEIAKGPSLPPLHIVLVNPRAKVPTGAIFGLFDASPAPQPFSLPHASSLPSFSAVVGYINSTRNDLAPFARRFCPQIEELEAELRQAPGCLSARMSGSGATVFGLFGSGEAAKRAARKFRARGDWSVSARLYRRSAKP